VDAKPGWGEKHGQENRKGMKGKGKNLDRMNKINGIFRRGRRIGH
jgi:hypothetical protein